MIMHKTHKAFKLLLLRNFSLVILDKTKEKEGKWKYFADLDDKIFLRYIDNSSRCRSIIFNL